MGIVSIILSISMLLQRAQKFAYGPTTQGYVTRTEPQPLTSARIPPLPAVTTSCFDKRLAGNAGAAQTLGPSA